MAGMFYSFEEVMAELSMTEDQVNELVADGKLKEFRDGEKVLFKVEQVQELSTEKDDDIIELEGDVDLQEDVASQEDLDDEIDLDELNLDISSEGSSIELLLDETTQTPTDTGSPQEESIGANITGFGDDADLAEMSKADTNIGTTGINVLADTDDEYKLTSDTKSDTFAADGDATGLGSLDDDINMDSVGSGSGLLDLSLQADDTSLGAVLDDILPAAGEGEAPLTAEESHMAEEADKIFEEAGDGAPVAQAAAPMMAAAYVELEADAMSNACGMMLIIPIIALLYAVMVVLMGIRGISPTIVKFATGDSPLGMAMIWLVVIVLTVVSLLIVGIGAMTGGKGKKGKDKDVYRQAE